MWVRDSLVRAIWGFPGERLHRMLLKFGPDFDQAPREPAALVRWAARQPPEIRYAVRFILGVLRPGPVPAVGIARPPELRGRFDLVAAVRVSPHDLMAPVLRWIQYPFWGDS